MQTDIKILADKHILVAEEGFPPSITLDRFDPNIGIPSEVTDYDALLIRTVTPVNASTIPENPGRLKFIGSATAGIDHADNDWLQSRGIEFAYSPGCNASSVGEYIGVALLAWSLITKSELNNIDVGIVGAGYTGTAVSRMLSELNIAYKLYDPPKEKTDPLFNSSTLEEVLSCRILTFHTPLTHHKIWPTFHWLNRDKLSGREFRLIINASRGGVIDEQALIDSFLEGSVKNYILDVWENEPVFSDQTAKQALIKTPHIAGYSIQSKRRATKIVMESLFAFFGIESDGYNYIPSTNDKPEVLLTEDQPDLLRLLFKLNPIHEYSLRFEMLIGQSQDKKRILFQQLRTGYPLRHEHPNCRVDKTLLEKFPVLYSLGFNSE